MNKKWVTIGVLGVLVLGGVYWGYKQFTAKPAATTFITQPVKMGDVTKVITATGTVNFPHSIPLTFKQAGQITEIDVKAGDSVKAGEVLAKTDDSSLQLTVQQQQAAVTSAQLKLQTDKDAFNDQTLASAQSAVAKAQQGVASAQQALTTAQQNADPNYLANQVALAKAAVQQASNDYAKAQLNGNASSTALAQAQTNLTTAQNNQNGGAAQALAAAQAQYQSAQADLASAQAQLAQQQQGPTAATIASDEASIQSAQVQLASAQQNLQNAEIIAPVDGVVVTMPLQLGQQSDASSIITITPSSSNLQVDASIDQSDIDQVKKGQKVNITLDSAPNQNIVGTVSQIALQGTIVSNVTTYDVTVTVDQPTDLLKAGMNANVSIIIAEAKNVLTVPSAAVKTKGTQAYVMVPTTGSGNASNQAGQGPGNQGTSGSQGAQGSQGNQGYQRSQGSQGGQSGNGSRTGSGSSRATLNERPVQVTVGLDDGTNVEIKSGLQKGQEVITGTRSASTTSNSNTNSKSGGLNFGGGGPNPARALSGGGGGFRGN